jgi:hypothetical protein
MDRLVEQLLYFYYHLDEFQDAYMPQPKAKNFFESMLLRGRLHVCVVDDVLLGYGESWRINFEQFGRIVCGINLYDTLDSEDIEHGNIAYLANVTIHPEHRGTFVIRSLRNDFFLKNKDAEYFVGHAKRKRKTQPWKIFSKQEAYEKWAINSNHLQEVLHG